LGWSLSLQRLLCCDVLASDPRRRRAPTQARETVVRSLIILPRHAPELKPSCPLCQLLSPDPLALDHVRVDVFHASDKVEDVVATLAIRETVPAIRGNRHLELIGTCSLVDRARALQALAVFGGAHLGHEPVSLQHLSHRDTRFECREVDEWFSHVSMNWIVVCGMFASCKHLQFNSLPKLTGAGQLSTYRR
jgi:hypothetical protein